jgi:hypothetical protein
MAQTLIVNMLVLHGPTRLSISSLGIAKLITFGDGPNILSSLNKVENSAKDIG